MGELVSDRFYSVSVTQAFEMIHVVKARNKEEARRIIQELVRGNIERDDPRLIESFPSGHVGAEKVSLVVYRENW